METYYGYTQYRMNIVTDYANGIKENLIRMEMAWQNRNNFKVDEKELSHWLNNTREETLRLMNDLEGYLVEFSENAEENE